LTASGSLLDGVKFYKPLLALNCAALTNLERTYGKMSLTGDNPAEIIKESASLDADKYQLLLKNMIKLRIERLYTRIRLQ
jgi:hypothetical protein